MLALIPTLSIAQYKHSYHKCMLGNNFLPHEWVCIQVPQVVQDSSLLYRVVLHLDRYNWCKDRVCSWHHFLQHCCLNLYNL